MRQIKFLAITSLPLLVSACDALKASTPEFNQCKEVYVNEYLIPVNNGTPEIDFKNINTWASKEEEGENYIKVTFDSSERNISGTPITATVECNMSKKTGNIKLHSAYRNKILVGGPLLNAHGNEQLLSKYISSSVDSAYSIEKSLSKIRSKGPFEQ